MTLVNVTVPALLIVPEKLRSPPGATGPPKQSLVTTSSDSGWIGHELVVRAVTLVPPQMLVPEALTTSVMLAAQAAAGTGTRYEPEKFADSPTARLIGPNTGTLVET